MDIYERNRQRIAMVGSSGHPSPGETPLGTVVEDDPTWVCCCCDQDIPRPSGGFATPQGSFCAECFVRYMEHLFNGAKPTFLNAIRDETNYFVSRRREAFENGVEKLPKLKATTVRDVIEGEKKRFKALLRNLMREMDEDDEKDFWDR